MLTGRMSSVFKALDCSDAPTVASECRHANRRAKETGSTQLADLGLHQRPAFGAELFFPGRVNTWKFCAERRLVDFVEEEAALDEVLTELRIESSLILALPTDILCDIALDHGLDVVRQCLPGWQVRHFV